MVRKRKSRINALLTYVYVTIYWLKSISKCIIGDSKPFILKFRLIVHRHWHGDGHHRVVVNLISRMTTFLTRFFCSHATWSLCGGAGGKTRRRDTCTCVATPMKIHFCSQCYDQSFSVATATMHGGAAQHQSSRHVPVPRVIIAIFSILPSLKLDTLRTYMHTEASSIVQQKKLGS